jgi:hypothetical protein
MREYEVRILAADKSPAVLEIMHLTDNAAIRAAKKIAQGQPFEVWRGPDRIHNQGR